MYARPRVFSLKLSNASCPATCLFLADFTVFNTEFIIKKEALLRKTRVQEREARASRREEQTAALAEQRARAQIHSASNYRSATMVEANAAAVIKRIEEEGSDEEEDVATVFAAQEADQLEQESKKGAEASPEFLTFQILRILQEEREEKAHFDEEHNGNSPYPTFSILIKVRW